MNPASRYTGAYGDPITGGYPLGNGYRVYLPHLMRFCVSDGSSPFGGGGVNPYAYCAADPANRWDPSGHVSVAALAGTLAEQATVDAMREAAGLLAGKDAGEALAQGVHRLGLADDAPASRLRAAGTGLRQAAASNGQETVFTAPRIAIPEATDTLASSRVSLAHVDDAKSISLVDRESPSGYRPPRGGSRRARAYEYDSDESDDAYSPDLVDSKVAFIRTMRETVGRRLSSLRRKVASNYRVLGVGWKMAEEHAVDADFDYVRVRRAALNLRSEIGSVIDHPAFYARREELAAMRQSVDWLL